MAWNVPEKLNAVVITSSPASTPTAYNAAWMAAVPELNRTACATPRRAAHSRSRLVASTPLTPVSSPRSSTFRTAALSSGRMSGHKRFRPCGTDGVPPWIASASFIACTSLQEEIVHQVSEVLRCAPRIQLPVLRAEELTRPGAVEAG